MPSYFLSLLHAAIREASPIVRQYGLGAVTAAIFIENMGGVFIPGESLMVASGFLAAKGLFPLWALIALAIAAATIGSYVAFALGSRLGREGLLRWGRRIGLTEARLDKTHAFFERFGPLIILVGRFIVPLRQLQGYVAGTAKMTPRAFGLWSLVGAILWVIVWGGGAYWFAGDLLPKSP